MPHGTDPLTVQRAAREFAQEEFAERRYVMVLHDHQANPHAHLSVRAESKQGKRLNPRKADLQRWRETFAEKLRGWGIDAEATRQATRGEHRNYDAPWRARAEREGRLRTPARPIKTGKAAEKSRMSAIEAWGRITEALDASERPEDRRLAAEIIRYLGETPVVIARLKHLDRQRLRDLPQQPRDLSRGLPRDLPEMGRTAPAVPTRAREARDIER
jgi:hypothetical protein